MAKHKQYTPEDKLRAVMMYRECGSLAQVARVTGFPRTTIKQWNEAFDEIPKETSIEVIEAEVVQHVADAKREFLNQHYKPLSEAFGTAVKNLLDDMKLNPPTALAAVTIAEKVANIIKLFSTAETTGAANTENLLDMCIKKINGEK